MLLLDRSVSCRPTTALHKRRLQRHDSHRAPGSSLAVVPEFGLSRTSGPFGFDDRVELVALRHVEWLHALHAIDHRESMDRVVLLQGLVLLELKPSCLTATVSRYADFVTPAAGDATLDSGRTDGDPSPGSTLVVSILTAPTLGSSTNALSERGQEADPCAVPARYREPLSAGHRRGEPGRMSLLRRPVQTLRARG